MKKTGLLLKILLIVGLSILLVLRLGAFVYAADDDTYSSWDSTDTTGDWTSTTTPTPSTTTTTPTPTPSSSTQMPELNTDDKDDSEVKSLAYTGAESNSILAIVIILGVIVAGYSYKKVKEYSNL